MNERLEDIQLKTQKVREVLQQTGAAAVRFRGIEWFGWITAGGSSAVLQTVEGGVAEVLVTPTEYIVLTDEIEAPRIRDEELPEGTRMHAVPWTAPQQAQQFVQGLIGEGQILSDRPAPGELPLPESLYLVRHQLTAFDIERYRELGRLGAQAMTEAMLKARPEHTENQLSGLGALALRDRGLDVGLIQVAGERRLQLYRHLPPNDDVLGRQAMMSFCARKGGLWVSLTRFVAFGPLTDAQLEKHQKLQQIEAALLAETRPASTMGHLYQTVLNAYASHREAHAIQEHHQGGLTGYGCRERVATPGDAYTLQGTQAFAWNPSLRGAKLEDTILMHPDSTLEVLTLDPTWPTQDVQGLPRPTVWQHRTPEHA
ncbi:M24 family metallopeptidase [Deinococcus cellulosilyticus]|uniref:Peptidase M24 n=1 Tax=Deinococcus cellulosilyticus (strain DSM 18568 / NBRC 106333 / KACC 11606 / 5516J-15) TaxID=1223518 RepID=A0A511MZR0_DEIC1|nr:M24 family metallopeptidase [Deinococcus cellulosilyticus]GEM46039.1 peptidase M24 [Deinococcus cellulosilyticus NBRC 106333 = KACC 11606]